jgi:hypothetical protein
LFQVLILDDSPPPCPSLVHKAESFGAGGLGVTSAADSADVYADDNFEEAEMIFSQVHFHNIGVACIVRDTYDFLQSFQSARSGDDCMQDSEDDGEHDDMAEDGAETPAVVFDVTSDLLSHTSFGLNWRQIAVDGVSKGVTAGRILVEESDDDVELRADASGAFTGPNDTSRVTHLQSQARQQFVNETQFPDAGSLAPKTSQASGRPSSPAPLRSTLCSGLQRPEVIAITSSSSTSTVGSAKRGEWNTLRCSAFVQSIVACG